MTDDRSEPTADLDGSDPAEIAIDVIGHEEQLHGLAVAAGVTVGVFDYLDDGPTSATEVAAALDLDTDHTYRLLRALGSVGVLDADEERRFSLTPVGRRFRADHPESVRDFVLFLYDPARLAAIRHLPDVVRDGDRTAYEPEFDCGLFEY